MARLFGFISVWVMLVMSAAAQTGDSGWPQRTIRLIVPWPPGGGAPAPEAAAFRSSAMAPGPSDNTTDRQLDEARKALLAREKEFTKARDALNTPPAK